MMDNLHELLSMMAHDHKMQLKPISDFPDNLEDFNMDELELLSSELSGVDKEILACGENDEIVEFIKKYPKMLYLDLFLVEAYDGSIVNDFFDRKL